MTTLGLADLPPAELAPVVLAAWDDFRALAAECDLSAPSRLPGWRAHEVLVHLGAWPDKTPLAGLVQSARDGASGDVPEPDADNARLVQIHRDASRQQVLDALTTAREAIADFFASDLPAEIGRLRSQSSLGPLPVLTLVHASTYELAVHALDLAPCGAPPPPASLLERGLASLMDVTGSLASRAGIDITVTAQSPEAGWAFDSDGAEGWDTRRTGAGRFEGPGVRGSLADLLDASAGRAALPSLLVTRRLVVQHLPSFMRLAPLVSEVPGLPGGAALKTGVSGVAAVTDGVASLAGGIGKALGRFRR